MLISFQKNPNMMPVSKVKGKRGVGVHASKKWELIGKKTK